MPEQRLIDANALEFEPNPIDGTMNGVLFLGRSVGRTRQLVQYTLKQMIDNAPTVDAVEVVRCKDCKHAREMNHREKQLYLEGCVMCSQIDINGEQNPMLPDDFCSYGERKCQSDT